MKLTVLEYVGHATVDKRLSNPMIPWIIAQIRRGHERKMVQMVLDDNCLAAYCEDGSQQIFAHPLTQISRLTMTPGDQVSMFYTLKSPDSPQLLFCHLYQSPDPENVMEVMTGLRQWTKLHSFSQSQSLTSDLSPSSSQFFEVLYIGKIKVSHKKVPETFIDEALDKFTKFEKLKRQKDFQSQDCDGDVGVDSAARYGSIETLRDAGASEPAAASLSSTNGFVRRRSGSMGSVLPMQRVEALSVTGVGSAEECTLNRTMVFHVGRTDLRLVSPDRKQVLLHKQIKDIITCMQGVKHSSHFAFICRESGLEQPHYIGFVFKCESSSVAGDIVTAINPALSSGRKEAGKNTPAAIMSCEHCPLVWYHKLCHDLESAHDIAAQLSCVMKRVEMLSSEEQVVVETKLTGAATPEEPRERLELLMMLLRAHCEAKQSTHIHDTPQTRHEFLNNYLGGGTIFMKAKRSLTNSFDQLLKRRNSQNDIGQIQRVLSLPPNSSLCKDETLSPIAQNESQDTADSEEQSGPKMNIFKKVGRSPTINGGLGEYKSDESEEEEKPMASWRQAIFNTVITPSKERPPEPKRDGEYFRSLWKKAINQQLLLIRMERENAKLTARQEVVNVKRIKLEYEELGYCENMQIWDDLLNNHLNYFTDDQVRKLLFQGIPKVRRGEVWTFLSNKYNEEVDLDVFPNYDTSYENLLKQLTSHQHAILIDLGRTFPSHKYFSSTLGPGQLALFNILKAYSLLDPEVGYCQGLSFIAAVLLLHMSESESFHILKKVMVEGNVRMRYLPDMCNLQVMLYQLSRLLLDTYPDLYRHLDAHEVAPTLYAAPWFLTLFSSQFPLGFVARVLDVLIGGSSDTMFCIALSLLAHHKDNLIECHSFEQIMDYFKNNLPQINKDDVTTIMDRACKIKVVKQLTEYSVEYNVLQEQMASPRAEMKKIKQLETANAALVQQNKAYMEQVQNITNNVKRLENSRAGYLSQINKLESQVKNLESTLNMVTEYVATLTDVPEEIIRNLRRDGVKRVPKSAPLRVIQDDVEDDRRRKDVVTNSGTDSLRSKVTNLFKSNGEVGRMLTDKDKESIAKRNVPRPLKSSQSSFELNRGPPLDSSNGVQVKFQGTTKLRSFRSRPSLDQLRIIETNDSVSDKLKATMDKVTHLFEETPKNEHHQIQT